MRERETHVLGHVPYVSALCEDHIDVSHESCIQVTNVTRESQTTDACGACGMTHEKGQSVRAPCGTTRRAKKAKSANRAWRGPPRQLHLAAPLHCGAQHPAAKAARAAFRQCRSSAVAFGPAANWATAREWRNDFNKSVQKMSKK